MSICPSFLHDIIVKRPGTLARLSFLMIVGDDQPEEVNADLPLFTKDESLNAATHPWNSVSKIWFYYDDTNRSTIEIRQIRQFIPQNSIYTTNILYVIWNEFWRFLIFNCKCPV